MSTPVLSAGGRFAKSTPWSRLPVGKLLEAHPLPPPAPRPWRRMFPRWRGRGIIILEFNRIFKGALPPWTPMIDSLF